MNDEVQTVRAEIERAFAGAGVQGVMHAVDIDSGREIGVSADELVVAASVFKLPVLVELCRQYAAGILSPRDRIRVAADEFVLGSGAGLAGMLDDVEMSLRDLSLLMMSISDNRATDVIAERVGLANVNAMLRRLGLTDTAVDVDCRGIFQSLREDLGIDLETLNDKIETEGMDDRLVGRLREMRCVTPAATNRTTARETTRLLTAIWREELIAADAAVEIRRILGQQVWPHRLATGFPDSRIRLSGKTGTMMFVRNEAGVVEFPNGPRLAIAVFLREPDPEIRNPEADRVIGTAAALAADHLRAVS